MGLSCATTHPFCELLVVTLGDTQRILRRRGFALEFTTLGWNVVGVIVVAGFAIASSSVALAGFALDSLLEIGASAVVIWELAETGEARRARALRLIGLAFLFLAAYVFIQSTGALITAHHASVSVGGILWTAITAIVMFALAAAKRSTGRALANPVLTVEARVTFVDGLLALAVLLGLVLDFTFGWWWADSVAAYVIVYYAIREAIAIFRPTETR